mmetsp:Transcript_75735/g.245136  ORF Transcript_75735/g.245136 Transcript_75735/m.245136 type:complete len:226 (+) Transcript_75735:756-1433(+)
MPQAPALTSAQLPPSFPRSPQSAASKPASSREYGSCKATHPLGMAGVVDWSTASMELSPWPAPSSAPTPPIAMSTAPASSGPQTLSWMTSTSPNSSSSARNTVALAAPAAALLLPAAVSSGLPSEPRQPAVACSPCASAAQTAAPLASQAPPTSQPYAGTQKSSSSNPGLASRIAWSSGGGGGRSAAPDKKSSPTPKQTSTPIWPLLPSVLPVLPEETMAKEAAA